jgi:hypothetical protein
VAVEFDAQPARGAHEYAVHPAAEIFPLTAEGSDDWNEIERSMRERGFDPRFPVLLWRKQVIDGRNRLRIALALGIAPIFADVSDEEVGDSPADFVRRTNARRNLTAAQRATVAVEYENEKAREAAARIAAGRKRGGETGGRGRAKPDSSSNGPSLELSAAKQDDSKRAVVQAAKEVGAGINSTQQLKAVREKAPEVFELVKAGAVAKVAEAVALAKAPEEERAEAVERIKAGEKPADVVRELPKPERKASAPRWDADGRVAKLNALLSDLHHECPAADAAAFVPVFEKWARKFREKSA